MEIFDYTGIGITENGDEYPIDFSCDENGMYFTVVRDEYGEFMSGRLEITKNLAMELFEDYGIVKIKWDDGGKDLILK